MNKPNPKPTGPGPLKWKPTTPSTTSSGALVKYESKTAPPPKSKSDDDLKRITERLSNVNLQWGKTGSYTAQPEKNGRLVRDSDENDSAWTDMPFIPDYCPPCSTCPTCSQPVPTRATVAKGFSYAAAAARSNGGSSNDSNWRDRMTMFRAP
jgi:hypothetical protein